MPENGEIDLLNNVSKTSEREEIYDFSSLASGENIAYVVMKSGDTRVAMNDLDAIGHIIWFDNNQDATQTFESGEANAHVVTSSSIKKLCFGIHERLKNSQ